MFDALGGSWPKHACFNNQYNALVAKVMPILGAGADPASATFKPFADLKSKFEGGLAKAKMAKKAIVPPPPPSPAAEKTEHVVKRMDPMEGEEISFIGVVREKQSATSKLKSLYAALGSIGIKAFELPSEKNAVQITVVEASGEPNESYSAVADRSSLDSSVAVGVMVWVRMKGKVVPSAASWVILEIQPL